MKPYMITLLGGKNWYLGDESTERADRKDTDYSWGVSETVVVYGESATEAVNKYVRTTKYVGTFLVSSPTETETQVVLVEPKSETDAGEPETPNNVVQ